MKIRRCSVYTIALHGENGCTAREAARQHIMMFQRFDFSVRSLADLWLCNSQCERR